MNNQSPLLLAAWKGKRECVDYLIEKGADVNQKQVSYGKRIDKRRETDKENEERDSVFSLIFDFDVSIQNDVFFCLVSSMASIDTQSSTFLLLGGKCCDLL